MSTGQPAPGRPAPSQQRMLPVECPNLIKQHLNSPLFEVTDDEDENSEEDPDEVGTTEKIASELTNGENVSSDISGEESANSDIEDNSQ